MDDEMPPQAPGKPSQAPSWATLGFVLGALFVLALPRHRDAPLPPTPSPSREVRREAPRLTTVEAVFAEWGKYAVWEHDLTEVALWNASAGAYTDYFEVLHLGGTYYFRSIPHLTRSILTHGGIPKDSPLEFTETEEQRREWLGEKTEEDWRLLKESLHHDSGAPTAPSPVQNKP